MTSPTAVRERLSTARQRADEVRMNVGAGALVAARGLLLLRNAGRVSSPAGARAGVATSMRRLPVSPASARSVAVTGARYGRDAGPYAVAHRGGAGLAPENTLEAFGTALALGVRYLETDARVTADGVAVAFHDETLDRVTGLRGPVAAQPWSRVRTTLVDAVEPVATLEDVLGSFPGARFTVDVKEAKAIGPTVRAVRRTRSAERVCVAGGWDAWLRAVASGCGPQVTTALGWRSLTTLISCARAGVRPPRAIATGAWAHVPWRLGRLPVMADQRVAARLVSMAAGLGVRVLVWTVDEPAHMRRLLDDGVDGVITDRPDLLREVLVSRGRWQPMGAD